MNDNEKLPTGMSAVERAIRQMLERIAKQPDYEPFIMSVGEARTLMHDIAMWRNMARDLNEDAERMQRAIESLENERRGERS